MSIIENMLNKKKALENVNPVDFNTEIISSLEKDFDKAFSSKNKDYKESVKAKYKERLLYFITEKNDILVKAIINKLATVDFFNENTTILKEIIKYSDKNYSFPVECLKKASIEIETENINVLKHLLSLESNKDILIKTFKSNRIDTAVELISKDADLEATDNRGRDIARLAISRGEIKLLEKLKEKEKYKNIEINKEELNLNKIIFKISRILLLEQLTNRLVIIKNSINKDNLEKATAAYKTKRERINKISKSLKKTLHILYKKTIKTPIDLSKNLFNRLKSANKEISISQTSPQQSIEK